MNFSIKELQSRTAKSLRFQVLLVLIILDGAVVLWTGSSLLESRQHYEQQVVTATQNLAQVLDQSVTGSIEKIDLTLRTVVDDLEQRLRSGGNLDEREVNAFLQAQRNRLAELYGIRIADAAGHVILGNNDSPNDQTSMADRDYFGILSSRPDAGLAVTNPIMGRVSKIWIIAFSRRYNKPDGSFAGVVIAVVPVEYFAKLLSALDVGPHGIIVLRDANLGLIARHPAIDTPAGAIGATGFSKEMSDAVASGRSSVTFHSKTTADRVERTVTYRRLTAAPFHLAVGMGSEDYLKAWHAEVLRTAIEVAFFILVSSGAGWLLWRSLTKIRIETEHSQLLLRSASDGIHVLDPDGNVLEVSDSFCAMLGYSREELVGANVSLWDAQWSPQELKRGIAELLAKESRSVFETQHRCRDGSILDVEIACLGLELGGKRALFNSARELTERKQAEKALRQSAAEYRSLVDTTADGFWVVDENGRLLDVNNAYCRLTGYSREELLGMSISNLEAKQSPEEVARHIASVVTTGRDRFEAHHRCKDGHIAELEVSVTYLPASKRFFCFGHDIAERKRAQAEIHTLNEDLERRVAARTAELERAGQELESFSYSISHDLRAPLRAINGFAHLLLEDEESALSPEGSNHLDRIVRNTTKMQQLIDDILAFSRVSRAELNKGRVDVESLARTALSELAGDYPRTEVRIGALPPAMGDGALLKQVFANLIGNALKYSAKKEAPVVAIDARWQSGETVYVVTDNGAGFDMQHAATLFRVFRRLHSADEFAGTGIGLAIVKHIVERHGGRVWAEAAVDKGATFHFTLAQD